jgi:hypothetical protein
LRWAIVIGIDDYRGQEPTLRAAVYDAVKFSRWVIDKGGVPEKQVRRLLGRRRKNPTQRGTQQIPTKDNVLKVINEVMAESGGVGDKLFFFFAGHGVTMRYANREESALVFPGIDEHHPAQTLAVRSLTEFFETTRFLDQFFFIDACRSPLTTRYGEIGAWPIPRRREPGQDPPQQFILYATSPDRTAEDAVWENEHSAFSKVLMPGLQGKGRAKAWSWERNCYEVRWERLATYVHDVMQSRREENEFGEARYPFQIPQDVGIRGVACRDRDALLARPRGGEVKPLKLRLDLGSWSAQEARVTVLDAIGVAVADAVRVTGRFHEFTLPPRTYAARVTTPDGRERYVVPPIELYDQRPPRVEWLEEDEPLPKDPYAPGTITIESPDPLAVADVRDETGRVTGVATHTDGCATAPGFYRVRLVGPERDKVGTPTLVLLRASANKTVPAELPKDARDERAAELAAAFGGTAEAGYVTPAAGARPAAWAQPSTVVAAGIGAALHGDRTALKALGLEKPPEPGEEGSVVAFFAVAGTGDEDALGRLRIRIWPAGQAVPVKRRAPRQGTAGVAAAVENMETPKPYWVSIEAPNAKPTVVGLTPLKGRLATLVAQVDQDRVRLYQFHPLAQPVESSKPDGIRRLEYLQRQLLGGRLDGAEDIVLGGRPGGEDGAVTRIAAEAKKDPFGGCLVGYILLRLGLHEWLGGLSSAIIEAAPTLSDAYILRGEYEAYKQNQEASNQAFAEAVSAGVPAFGEGLTRLVEGLRKSGFVHPRGALVRYIFQRHARGYMWAVFTPRDEFEPGRLVITGSDIGYEG